MYKSKKSGVVGIIVTIILLILLVVLSNTQIDKLAMVEDALSSLVMPIQNGLTYLKNKIAKNDTFFVDISNLKEENQKLKEENSQLEQKVRELEITKTENATLKEYLNLTEKYSDYETIPGYVINKDVSNYTNVLVINLGSDDGIEVNMPVISDQGLVRVCHICYKGYF